MKTMVIGAFVLAVVLAADSPRPPPPTAIDPERGGTRYFRWVDGPGHIDGSLTKEFDYDYAEIEWSITPPATRTMTFLTAYDDYVVGDVLAARPLRGGCVDTLHGGIQRRAAIICRVRLLLCHALHILHRGTKVDSQRPSRDNHGFFRRDSGGQGGTSEPGGFLER